MSISLTTEIQNQINNKRLLPIYILKINNIDYSSYLESERVSQGIEFAASNANFILNNNTEIFSRGGSNEISVGDTVEYICKYSGDSTEFKRFYGYVEQRSINKRNRTIELICYDYISVLKNWDTDLVIEGDKIKVTNETLTPNQLPSPNEEFAQVFNFANNSIATNPLPILTIKSKYNLTEDPVYDGMEILYENGQVRLGAPLQTQDNYDLVAKSYFYYSRGVYIEDVIESLLTLEDGYGNYLFNEETSTDLINNHLTTTFQTQEGSGSQDTLTPNTSTLSIDIETQLEADHDPSSSGYSNSITVTSTKGFPNSGEAEINGDIFTYSSKDATHLYGINESGETPLGVHLLYIQDEGTAKEKIIKPYVKYTGSYSAGQVWDLSYNNLTSDLTDSDFSGISSGVTIDYLHKRLGRIILTSPISVNNVVKCINDYTFKTLQSALLKINKITFKPREVLNRFDAIKKVQSYCPPNYIIHATGDGLIWAKYFRQKSSGYQDYELTLKENLTSREDTDLYTRVKIYGTNKNPTNIAFSDDVTFLTTGNNYTAFANQVDLTYDRLEDGWYVYKSSISDIGTINLSSVTPIVYVNNIPIDNELHYIGDPIATDPIAESWVTTTPPTPIYFKRGTATVITSKGGKHPSTSSFEDNSYTVFFAHRNISPNHPIFIRNADSSWEYKIGAHSESINYGMGMQIVHSVVKDRTIEQNYSTASYVLQYFTDDLEIDTEKAEFKLRASSFNQPSLLAVSATFEYDTAIESYNSTRNIIDGRWNSQAQVLFYNDVPSGYILAKMDLGQIYSIQAIDIVAGFFKPPSRPSIKLDIDMRLTLKYSTDNIDYYDISPNTNNFQLTGGESISFEENELGSSFQARYFLIIIERLEKVEFGGKSVYPFALSEFSCYSDIVIESEATLIPYVETSEAIYAPTPRTPLLHYKMNDNLPTSTVIESIGNNNGTFKNSGGDSNTEDHSVSGKINTALDFDGNSYIDCGNNGNITGSLSIASWVKLTDSTPDNHYNIVSKTNLAYRFRINSDGKLWLLLNDGSYDVIRTDNSYLTFDSTWYHIAVVFDSVNQKVNFYVNGVLKETKNTTKSSIQITSYGLTIGAIDVTASSEILSGHLDDVRIYNSVLEQGDVNAIYYNGIGTETSTAQNLPYIKCSSTTSAFGSSGTAYLDKEDAFTYTSKSGLYFYNICGITKDYPTSTLIVQSIETDTSLYDSLKLLPDQGDRLYKANKIEDDLLFDESRINNLSKDYLKEFIKNHEKFAVSVVYSPYLKIGQTVLVTDTYHNISQNYFIDSITQNSDTFNVVLARYP